MSILAGRLAATEGAYFLNESKHAVGRLAQKLPPPTSSPSSSAAAAEPAADVLPEILRHSIPIRGVAPAADPSLSGSAKWVVSRSADSGAGGGVSRDVMNPLSAYVRMPQATFGPKRWQLPNGQSNVSASTANELRRDRYPPADPEKLKALAVGYLQLGKAFAIATTMVFGGATFVFAYTAINCRWLVLKISNPKEGTSSNLESIVCRRKCRHYEIGLRIYQKDGTLRVVMQRRRLLSGNFQKHCGLGIPADAVLVLQKL